MLRRRISTALAIVVAVQLSVAALPHLHHHDFVRVASAQGAHDGGGSGLVAPVELLPAPACLACATHLPAAAAPGEPIGLPAPRPAAAVDEARSDGAATILLSPQRSRGPPGTA